jgi:hypothetical protein
MTGTKIVHVSYKNGAQAVTDVNGRPVDYGLRQSSRDLVARAIGQGCALSRSRVRTAPRDFPICLALPRSACRVTKP